MISALLLASTLVSNKVVFVDQDGKINAPEVVASVGDMAANKTEIAIAQAAATAAEKAAREGTNLVSSIVQAITENEFVVYRRGFTDSLGVMVALPPDTKCIITSYTPNIALDGKGNAQHELVYATTADASAVPPGIKHASTIEGGRDAMKALDTTIEKTNLATTYEDKDGTVYNYMYSVKFWVPVASQGFFIVYLDADAADGDGMTFDIVGGITGGYTGDILCGSDTLTFKGGLLMGVKNNE
ncbi:MAG: hypothetical protein J6V38_08055 [Kiritimatiellae bacterium]|nr:hypothetical protein [Kiritimatiellia bacterium]